MKIFHLSDLHIGLKLMNRDLREDQGIYFPADCRQGKGAETGRTGHCRRYL